MITPEKFNLDEELGLDRRSKRNAALQEAARVKPAPVAADAAHQGPRRIDLIALDLDGTLLSSDKRLSVKAIDAVTEARKRGVKVVIATARPPRTVKEVYDHLKLNTHQINYNGGLIQHPEHDSFLHHEPISPDLAFAICTVARKTDRRCIIALEILDKWYTDKHDETLVTETSKKFKPDYVGPLLEPLRQPVTKLMVMAPPDRLSIIRDTLVQRYKDAATFVLNEDHLVQISSAKADKHHGLRFLCEKYGVEAQHVMAIGDGPNDAGMLRFAGLGVAMGNAFPEARAAADVVVPSNDQDGVAHAIWKYVL